MYEVPPTPPQQPQPWSLWRAAAGSVMFGVGAAGVRWTGGDMLNQLRRGAFTSDYPVLVFGWSCLLLAGALAYAIAGQHRWARRVFWGLIAGSGCIGVLLWSTIQY